MQRSGLACAGWEQALGLEGSDDDPHRTGKGELQPPLNRGKGAGGEGQGRGRFSTAGVAAGGKEGGERKKAETRAPVPGSRDICHLSQCWWH